MMSLSVLLLVVKCPFESCSWEEVAVPLDMFSEDEGGEERVLRVEEEEGGLVTTVQIRALWSALQVARWRTSGERSTRVMKPVCAGKEHTGTREVTSRFWISFQT